MMNSDNKKTRLCIDCLPSYEINRFIDRVSTRVTKEQKNDAPKIACSEMNNTAKIATDLPPSCEPLRKTRMTGNE